MGETLTREQLDRIVARITANDAPATAMHSSAILDLCAMARASLDLAEELGKTKADYAAFVSNMLTADKRRDELAEERHAIGVTPEAAAWVIGKVVEAIDVGPSFRAFVYGLMGFGPESYTPLYLAGGMAFTNSIENAGVDAGVSVRRSDRRARRWEAFGRRVWASRCDTRRLIVEHDKARAVADDLRDELAREMHCRRAAESERDTEHALRLRQMGEASVTAAALSAAEYDRDAARRELGEVSDVLEGIEWAGRDADNELPCCPSCGGIEPGTRNRWAGQHSGHREDCALAGALGKEQGNG